MPALLALVAWGSSMAFATAPHPCGPSDAHTLAVNHLARVYVVRDAVYGCSRTHTTRLGGGAHGFREHVGPVALSGTTAAYGLTRSGVDTISAVVIVRGLRDGKQLRELAATTQPLGAEFVQAVRSIVVRTDCAVAWVGSGSSIIMQGRRDLEVIRADSRGEARIDSGSAIVPDSLMLRGTTLTWVHGTETRSATLH